MKQTEADKSSSLELADLDLVRNYYVDRCFQSELILNHNLSSSRNHKLISMLITFVIPNTDLNMLLLEILATTLAKLANFIPEAGIWMNTQRPEWNDANNALVGNGVSMVTLCYLRRFLSFFNDIFQNSSMTSVSISEELAEFFFKVANTFLTHRGLLVEKINDA